MPTRSDGSTPPGFDEQCRNAWGRILDLLSEQGMTVRDLVKVTTFLRDRSDKEESSRIRQDVLGDHLPALTVIVTGLFEADWLVEIEAVAAD